jgi:hypothetical protein
VGQGPKGRARGGGACIFMRASNSLKGWMGRPADQIMHTKLHIVPSRLHYFTP